MAKHKHHSKEPRKNQLILEVDEKDKKMRKKIQEAFINNNLEDLDDTRSVLSKASVFSKGYYRAPRCNFGKNKLFEDTEEARASIVPKGIGRTISSEYNYSDRKVFSKIPKKKNEEVPVENKLESQEKSQKVKENIENQLKEKEVQ